MGKKDGNLQGKNQIESTEHLDYVDALTLNGSGLAYEARQAVRTGKAAKT